MQSAATLALSSLVGEKRRGFMEREDERADLRGVLWMLASVVLFAANTLLIRAASEVSALADGWMALLFRGVIGVVLLQAIYRKGGVLDWRRMFSSRLVVMRGLIGGAAIICFYITIVKLGAARATVINLTYPMFATVIAAFWLKEKVRMAKRVWLAVALAGLVVFLSDGKSALTPSAYDLLALLGALAAGWVVVIIRKLRHDEHPAQIYGSLVVCSLLMGLPSMGKLPELSWAAWGFLAAAAFVVTFGQLYMTSAYQRLSIAHGSSLQMTLPVVTAFGAFLLFGETFQAYELAGALVTLFAIWRVAVGRI
jgi:drug/metabolite transporter (DMT)-like permease